MKQNVALLRVSTDMQDFDSQKNGIEKYVKEKNIVIHKTIEEHGVSGYKTKLEDRKGLQELIQMALNDEIENIIVFNQDRIGRRLETLSFMSIMNEQGVKIHSVTEGILNEQNDTAELIQAIKFWTASYESKKTSLRVQNGLKVAVLNNNGYKGGAVNFGYKLDGKKLVIDEYESEIVRLIFDKYIKYGAQNTVDYLNENNLLKRGEKWTRSKLFSVLKNNIYRGFKEYRNELIEIPSIRIISDETFNTANKRAKQRNQKGTNKYTNKTNILFEGLIFHKCPDDNIERKLYIDYVNTREGKVHTYRCTHCRLNKVETRKNFNSRGIEPILIKQIMYTMKNISIDKLEEEYTKALEKDTNFLKTSIKNIKDDISKKNKVIDKSMILIEKILIGDSLVDINVPNDVILKCRAEIKDLEIELEKYENELEELKHRTLNVFKLLDKHNDFEYIFENADDLSKKAILQELINKIVIDGSNIDIKLNLY